MVGFKTFSRKTKPSNLVSAKFQIKRKKIISKSNFNQYKTNDKTFMKIFPSLDDEENNKNF
jgi:hypothetical protein